MINVINNSTNPYFNLALEEYLLKQFDTNEPILMLWQNSPTIVIGKNQNTLEEINRQYIEENNIHVVRRLSGGGAVYHDLGNLNFTFILPHARLNKNDFSLFAKPILFSLEKLGLQGEFNGRNDITIYGKKFSGNAQYFYQNRILHHGTLLFNSDLSVLSSALQVKEKKYASKGIKSVQSRVANLKEFLQTEVSLKDFKDLLTRSIFQYHNVPYQEYHLTEQDLRKVNELVTGRYQTWEWNYGHSPHFNVNGEGTFAGGTVSVYLDVEKGLIKECKIFGDFFEIKPVEELENCLKGEPYNKTSLSALLEKINVANYIYKLENLQFLSYLF